MEAYPKIQELNISEKRVFIRADLNVPLTQNGGPREVASATRIEAALPTIRYVIEQGGKCILASHLGRPKGKVDPKYSLEPVGTKLSELLGKEVLLTEDCVGDGPRSLSQNLRSSQIMLLENLRFHPGEEKNDPKFASRLSELCDVYVSEAFGTLHRAHASTAGIVPLVSKAATGLLVQKELEYLMPLRQAPSRPFVLVMGGAKVSDKMGVMEAFLSKVDQIIIGGAMAYAFLKAQGYEIGNSLCEDDQVKLAKKLMNSARAREIPLLLPIDHIVATKFEDEKGEYINESAIPVGRMALDIGPETVDFYSKAISQAETIFWNGPLGVFEKKAFSEGTFGIAKAIAKSSALKLAGGGDVAAALAKSGCEKDFDFISTGGGATLEFLEGKQLPGLVALRG